jgi:hypothetical protein
VNTLTKKNKGTLVKGYHRFIKKKWGAEGLKDIKEKTGVDLSNIQDEKWYPYEDTRAVLEWVEGTHGMDYCRQLGFSTIAEQGIISFAARIIGIEKVLGRGIRDFRDTMGFGRIDIEIGEKRAALTLTDVCEVECECQSWLGAFQGLLELTKTKGTVTKTKCQAKGDDGCIYEMAWNK